MTGIALSAGIGLLLGNLALAAPAVAADPTLDATATDTYVRATMEAWGVPGIAAGIARDGEVIHLAAFGRAGADGRPMAIDTPIVGRQVDHRVGGSTAGRGRQTRSRQPR
jgi:hypothetical protein